MSTTVDGLSLIVSRGFCVGIEAPAEVQVHRKPPWCITARVVHQDANTAAPCLRCARDGISAGCPRPASVVTAQQPNRQKKTPQKPHKPSPWGCAPYPPVSTAG